MGLFDELSALKSKAAEQLPHLDAKRKRETALLLPFLAALGYSPFDVRDVEPGFSIRGEEGGDKIVDYAAKKGGSPALLFQLAGFGTPLDGCSPTSLLRALRSSGARVGALTDGLRYRFYADLQPFYAVLKGEMTAEEEPFLTLNLLGCSEREVEKLIPLTKPKFRADEILSVAHHRKYVRLFRQYLQRQREAPDQAFVQFLMEQVHGGTPPKGDPGMYASPVRDALLQLVSGEGRAEDQVPIRRETGEETTEEEDGSSASDAEASIDQNFRKAFSE